MLVSTKINIYWTWGLGAINEDEFFLLTLSAVSVLIINK